MKTVAGQSAAPNKQPLPIFTQFFLSAHLFDCAMRSVFWSGVTLRGRLHIQSGGGLKVEKRGGMLGGVPGWCSGSVPRVACCRLCLCGLLGLVGRNWLQRVLAPRGCGGLTIVLWMLAQLPIGRCAGQSDCEPGPVSVGTRLLHGSTFPRLPWPRPRGDTDCREPVLGKCVLSLGALPQGR